MLIRSIALIGIIAGFAIPEAASACSKWDLGSEFMISQQNGATVTINRIIRDGGKFEANAKSSGVRGDADGSIGSDGRFTFNIDWDNGSIGVYTAFVNADGEVLDGRTFDQTHPESWSTWTTENLACAE